MKAVITVIGKDQVGIIASVSAKCAEYGANITEITQSVLDKYFAMIMIADISAIEGDFVRFSDALSALGKESGLEIRCMHEDIFDAMHKI
ncbi:MAG: ACT domain-containing protein [Ruminococcaceae bacterium]|nr:ACT domain-containing protein [Oscillospiraceae bacterium]